MMMMMMVPEVHGGKGLLVVLGHDELDVVSAPGFNVCQSILNVRQY